MNITSNPPSPALLLREMGLDRDVNRWRDRLKGIGPTEVERALDSTPGFYHFEKLLALISPTAESYLEPMARMARDLTIRRFGRTIRLYAPLYLSSFCVNRCLYCGFNADTPFKRVRLSLRDALAEGLILNQSGIRDLLLVSGEDRAHVSVKFIEELCAHLRNHFCFVSIEVHRMNLKEYARLFEAGVEGVALYQETYDRDVYAKYHRQGPKADYDKRLSGPDDIAQAGMREVGLGVLLGLSDWRTETLALAEHVHHLIKSYWRTHVSISFPRLRPAHGVSKSQFPHLVLDKELVQMILALRLCFADVGLVLSTREPAHLRDHLIRLGITRMSAGSRTNPGGYQYPQQGPGQFQVDDDRSAKEIADMVRCHGLDPVWKDWDKAFL